MGIPVASGGTLTTWIKVFPGPPLLVRKARVQCQVSVREEETEGQKEGAQACWPSPTHSSVGPQGIQVSI